ncbi:Y-family DNA polymerase [Vagococcus elongatus]|uniref:Excinuclease ABC subunit A n=1 Tax=Vagococcus elongatus TaxID=180344 RepID=A0A430APU1_9ENTE|nr:Y-family DNA polymerase [Vagococcus elongatus]RSU10148.1 excinuclease ABC subunit A [Vagococcus elongatus]
MSNFDYSLEPLRDVLLIDAKSFYASCECVARGKHPLKTMLVVMSTTDNTGNGLVLAASPLAKKILGISNVTRADDVPDHPDLIRVTPRMNYYIEENIKINNIFRKYVADEDLFIYSIDESILDITRTLNLFFPDKTLTRRQKRWKFARMIQLAVKNKTGIYLTVGIGDNPLLAKLALDNESKHSKTFISEWRYEDVKNKVWHIHPMTDFWGIGRKMEKRFSKMGISSIKELANADPNVLNEKLGIMGLQYYHHANGVDRTILSDTAPTVKEKSYGNSQVLHRNYYVQSEIETVVKEMAEQVAARIRRHGFQTSCVNLYIGFSYHEKKTGFSHQMKIPATDSTKELSKSLIILFRKHYQGEAVRHIGVTYSKLTDINQVQMNLFEPYEELVKNENLDKIIDNIRRKYGFTAIVHANSLSDGARSIARSDLVSGHHGGGAGGLDGL